PEDEPMPLGSRVDPKREPEGCREQQINPDPRDRAERVDSRDEGVPDAPEREAPREQGRGQDESAKHDGRELGRGAGLPPASQSQDDERGRDDPDRDLMLVTHRDHLEELEGRGPTVEPARWAEEKPGTYTRKAVFDVVVLPDADGVGGREIVACHRDEQ